MMTNRVEFGADGSLEHLESIEDEMPLHGDIYSIEAHVVSPRLDFEYDMLFMPNHPLGQIIRISSEKPVDLLKKGSLPEAVGDLTRLALQTRGYSGAQIVIEGNASPVIGLATGGLDSVHPRNIQDPSMPLSIGLHLRDNLGAVDYTPELSPRNLPAEIGSVALSRLNLITRHSIAGDEMLERWTEKFKKLNSRKVFDRTEVPEPMELNPKKVAQLLMDFKARKILAEVVSARVQLVATSSDLLPAAK